jgi:predicted RNA-binding protein YlqC (UPF0109 family)
VGEKRTNGSTERNTSRSLPPLEGADAVTQLFAALAGTGYRVDASVTIHRDAWEQDTMPPEVLLEMLIKQFCDHPEEVRIESNITTQIASFDVRVAKSDFPKVLGSGASHAYAMRTIFGAIFGRLGKKLNLLIVDPRRG